MSIGFGNRGWGARSQQGSLRRGRIRVVQAVIALWHLQWVGGRYKYTLLGWCCAVGVGRGHIPNSVANPCCCVHTLLAFVGIIASCMFTTSVYRYRSTPIHNVWRRHGVWRTRLRAVVMQQRHSQLWTIRDTFWVHVQLPAIRLHSTNIHTSGSYLGRLLPTASLMQQIPHVLPEVRCLGR